MEVFKCWKQTLMTQIGLVEFGFGKGGKMVEFGAFFAPMADCPAMGAHVAES